MTKATKNETLTDSIELQFTYELRETSRVLLKALQRRLEPYDVTLTQYFLLRQVWGAEGISQGLLSERLGTTGPATVATVDSLEARGLIRRVRSTKDRRVVRLMITPRGRDMREALLDYAQRLSETALTGMSARDLSKLRTLLHLVRTNVANDSFGTNGMSKMR